MKHRKINLMRIFLYSLLTCLTFSAMPLLAATPPHPVPSIQDTETKAQRDARMAWWREARFGMFIHWGVYSVPAGVWHGKPVSGGGEWIMHNGNISTADYKALAGQFNPAKFDADAWVALAKAAGMKYIVFTAKHHDGFAMYHSEADPFNVVDATPFKRDPLKELAAACQKQGIKLGFYYSQVQDWTAKRAAAGHLDKAQYFESYLKTKAVPQLKELLNNYGTFPAVIWFDTGGDEKDMTPDCAAQIVQVLNQHPNLIWNCRLGGGYPGDYQTSEQSIRSGHLGEDLEACMTINDTWGYKSYDVDFKPADVLLRNLIDVASKGGNYLLNVGPDATGVIPQPEADRLRVIGHWLDINGEAIYGTGAGPAGLKGGEFSPTKKDVKDKPVFVTTRDFQCTTKPGKLFIHLFQWPGASFVLSGVKDKITKAYMLADPKRTPLTVAQNGTALTVSLPATAPDPIVSVLVLETK